MNILFLTPTLTKQAQPTFGAKKKTPDVSKIQMPQQATTDLFEATKSIEGPLPAKLEFTELEQKYYQILRERRQVGMELGDMQPECYSSRGKAEYKDLQRQKRNLDAKLKRLAKKYGVEKHYLVEFNISDKNQYNRYAPKILRATTIEELNDAVQKILNGNVYHNAKQLLQRLLDEQIKRLKLK